MTNFSFALANSMATFGAATGSLEVAITVGDSWQGRGVGRALLERLVALAKRGGYQTMCATALTLNTKMVRLARAFGFEIHSEPGGVTTMQKSLR